MELQAWILYKQCRFEEAKSETLYAISVYEKIGATKYMESCRVLIRIIEEKMEKQITSHESDFKGEPLEPTLLPTPANSPFSAQSAGLRLTNLFRRIANH